MASLLLVEDEGALQRLLSWALLDAGHEVALVRDAASAIDRLADYNPEVIVFNTSMEDGAKAIAMEEMRVRSPSSLILDVSEEKNMLRSGMVGISANGSTADATLDLPFPKERLIEAVDKLLASAR